MASINYGGLVDGIVSKKECRTFNEFMDTITENCKEEKEYTYLFRGEYKDYQKTKLCPTIFRNPNWIKNENRMLQDVLNQFPNQFPKGMRTFDALVDVQHYELPTRLLDFSFSPLVALFFSTYNFSKEKDIKEEEKGQVYVIKVKKEDINSVESDAVCLLSNLARINDEILNNKEFSKENFGEIMHIIKNERSDFYNMYYNEITRVDETYKYKNDFNKIIFVQPRMTNPRIIAQKGLFMLFGFNGTKDNYKALSIKYEDSFSIQIPQKSKDEILHYLSMSGFNKMTLCPDLQTVCEDIKDLYSK